MNTTSDTGLDLDIFEHKQGYFLLKFYFLLTHKLIKLWVYKSLIYLYIFYKMFDKANISFIFLVMQLQVNI